MSDERNAGKSKPGLAAERPKSGLRVPLPAMLAGLGVLAAASPAAHAATARPDTFSVPVNGFLSAANLLANDTVAGNSTTFLTALPSHGVANVSPNGLLFYSPNPGFQGVDTLSYTVNDAGPSSTAPVTLLVGAQPVATPTLSQTALIGLAGLLAFFGLRRRTGK